MSLLSVKGRKYGAITQITIKNQFAYLLDLFIRTLFLLLIIFVFLQLWEATYSGTDAVLLGGYRLEELIWYLIFAESMMMAVPKLHLAVEEEVKSGGIAYLLTRPAHYLLYRYMEFAGEFAVRLCVNLLAGGLLGTLLFGPPAFGWGWAGFAAAALGAMTLNYIIRMLLSLCAFWVEETQGLVFVYDKLLFTIGGMLLPLELMPGAVRSVCEWLPFQAIVYFPVKTAVQFDGFRLMEMLGIQLVWGLLLGGLLLAVYHKGVKKLNVNGG